MRPAGGVVSLDELLRGEVARSVLGALVRDLTARVRRDGLSLPAWAAPILAELALRADQPAPEMSVSERASGTLMPMTGMVTAAEAARQVGRSPHHVRRLAADGKIRHVRVGERALLVDLDSLHAVLMSAPAGAHRLPTKVPPCGSSPLEDRVSTACTVAGGNS